MTQRVRVVSLRLAVGLLLLMLMTRQQVHAQGKGNGSPKLKPGETVTMALPEDFYDDEIRRQWRCAACRVIVAEVATVAKEKRADQWALSYPEAVEDVCENTVKQ